MLSTTNQPTNHCTPPWQFQSHFSASLSLLASKYTDIVQCGLNSINFKYQTNVQLFKIFRKSQLPLPTKPSHRSRHGAAPRNLQLILIFTKSATGLLQHHPRNSYLALVGRLPPFYLLLIPLPRSIGCVCVCVCVELSAPILCESRDRK